ncbi:GTP binding domain containing protein [Aphelenchoides avenae]|nr:GTP binding domain containing protein [Aphelenchus avenae]
MRMCIVGRTNAGKTTLFNRLTGAKAPVSPRIFTTRDVMSGIRNMQDDQFEWLTGHFPNAKRRLSTITFVDTPAVLSPFGMAPWKNDVLDALRACDVFFLVITAFNDSTSLRDVSEIMWLHDLNLLSQLRENDSFRNDLDTLSTIKDNIRGSRRYFDGDKWSPIILTDVRVRFHDWSEEELAVLERFPFLTAKPIVYILNLDDDAFANPNSSKTFVDAKAYIEGEDKDALVVPFRGRVREQENTTTLLDSAELSGVDAIVEKTLEDCQIGYFFTANENLVAAWAFNLGTSVEEAIGIINATFASNATVVEAVSMDNVVEAGSIKKALSLLVTQLGFEDEIEDGDLLLLTPGQLHEVARETTELKTSPSTPGSLGSQVPSEKEGRSNVTWGYVASLLLNLVLLIALIGASAMLFSKKLRDRAGLFVNIQRRSQEHRREPLLGEEAASSGNLETAL